MSGLLDDEGDTVPPPVVFLQEEAGMTGHVAAFLLVFAMGVFAGVSVWLACYEGRE